MKAAAGLPLALLAAWLITACGSPTASPAATGASPSPAASPAASPVPSAEATRPGCDLAPATLIREQLGLAVNDPNITTTTQVTTCAYAIGSNPFGVLLRFQVRQDEGSFMTGRAGFKDTVNVSGLGDEAYSSTQNGYSTLVARKGTIGILITSRATLAAETRLMVILLAKV